MMRALALAAALTLGAAVPVAAQSQAERLAQLMSRDFAAQSAAALWTGDRAGAIVLALRGFPEDPTEADIESYPEAYTALLHAMVSRSVRIPISAEVATVVDPTGRRIATVTPFPLPQGNEPVEPLKLWDTQTGTLVAELLPLSATSDEGSGSPIPVFSPNGATLAILARKNGELMIFDAGSGALLRRIAAYPPDTMTLGIAFSPDSRILVTTGENSGRLDVWDTTTGARIATHRSAELGCLFIPIHGGRGGVVHVLEAGFYSLCDGRQVLHRVATDGTMQPLLDLAGIDALAGSTPGVVDEDGTRMILMTETYGAAVLGLDGQILAQLPPSATGSTFMRFARDGTALVGMQGHEGGGTSNRRVVDFAGNQLAPEPDDGLGFVHGAYSEAGARLGETAEWNPVTYEGHDIPRGLALYDFVWSAVPQSVRDQVTADRVTRP